MSELAATADAVLLLVTSMPSTTIVEGAQANLRNIFRGKKIEVEEIDGVDANNKALRSEMFNISNLRGSTRKSSLGEWRHFKVRRRRGSREVPERLRGHPCRGVAGPPAHRDVLQGLRGVLAADGRAAAASSPPKRILEGIDNVMPSAHPTHHPRTARTRRRAAT